jgi:uncharacterized protein YkwD
MAWHWFVPHEINDHQPHFLRRNVIVSLTVAVLVVQLTYVVSVTKILPSSPQVAAVLPGVLVDETNQQRLAMNLPLLQRNPLLDQAAKAKAEDMATKGYFAHASPIDGTTPWHWLDQAGVDYIYAGENLAVNFTDHNRLMNAWLNSPTHRANIVDPKYNQIGMATAVGMYKGRESLFVVQYFTSSTFANQQQTAAAGESGVFDRLLVSPHGLVMYLYAALAALIILALIIKIFTKTKTKYPELIAHGMALLLILIALIYLNSELINRGAI